MQQVGVDHVCAEMVEGTGERLNARQRMILGQHVHRVLHRVGRDDVAVVAVRVATGEVAFEGDVDADLLQLVPLAVPRDFRQPHVRLAVRIVLQHRHGIPVGLPIVNHRIDQPQPRNLRDLRQRRRNLGLA